MGRAKRSLSQNFLVDPNLQRKVVEALEADPADTVLEVGAGHGELSRHLVGRVARLILLEKDDALAAGLHRSWGAREDVQVLHADVLETDLSATLPSEGGRRVLSNLPYGITSPLLFRFLAIQPPVRRIVVTVQREVARRLVAEPGTGAYGSLTVGVRLRADVRLAFEVSRHAFRPVPRVESATVVIDPDPRRVAALPEEAVRRLTRAAFGRRRKQLRTILRRAPEYRLDRGQVEVICGSLGLDPTVRPERLEPRQFLALARRLETSEHAGEGKEG